MREIRALNVGRTVFREILLLLLPGRISTLDKDGNEEHMQVKRKQEKATRCNGAEATAGKLEVSAW